MSTETTLSPPFSDPWGDIPNAEKSRVQTFAHSDYYLNLQALNPGLGNIQTTISILIKNLIDECRRRNINDYRDADRFRELVVGFGLSERSTTPEPANDAGTETHARNVHRGDAGFHPSSPGEPDSSRPNARGDGKGSGRKAKGKG